MVTTFTYKSSLVQIDHAISSYHGNRPTNTQIQTPTQTQPQTHREDRLQYTVVVVVVVVVKEEEKKEGGGRRRGGGAAAETCVRVTIDHHRSSL